MQFRICYPSHGNHFVFQYLSRTVWICYPWHGNPIFYVFTYLSNRTVYYNDGSLLCVWLSALYLACHPQSEFFVSLNYPRDSHSPHMALNTNSNFEPGSCAPHPCQYHPTTHLICSPLLPSSLRVLSAFSNVYSCLRCASSCYFGPSLIPRSHTRPPHSLPILHVRRVVLFCERRDDLCRRFLCELGPLELSPFCLS